jgi:hypothetical protein
MSRNTPARYRATRITLAVGTGFAVVAGGVFLAGNGNNGASTVTGTDTSAIVATDGASAATVAPSTPAVTANTNANGEDDEEDDSGDSSTNQPTAQATAQPTASIQKSRVSRGS